MVFLACSAFWGSLCPAELIIPIPPIMKKKSRISPARTKEIFKKRETRLLIWLVYLRPPELEFLKNASPIENANLFTRLFYYSVKFETSKLYIMVGQIYY